MASEDKTPAEETVELLREILTWTKVGMYSAVEDILRRQFGGEDVREEERLAYELLDGERQQKDIVEICKATVKDAKISAAPLSRWITKWETVGLVRKDGRQVKHLFSLRDFGFQVPEPRTPTAKAAKKGDEQGHV